MSNYRFNLEKYNGMKTLFKCPNCNRKTFTKYIDNETKEYLRDDVGRCSRLVKCNYHYKPKAFFQDTNYNLPKTKYIPPPKLLPKPPTFIKTNHFHSTIGKQNNFSKFLINLFDDDTVNYLMNKYKFGSFGFWFNDTVFWQLDEHKNVRSGKVMLYDEVTGKRIKKPYNHINWVHKILKLQDFNLKQCLYGLHLINEDKSKPIAIVESEKTAIILSIAIPEFIWLACGSVNNLNYENTKVLKGRKVVLYPDLKCFDLWSEKVSKLYPFATYTVSTLLRDKATEEEKEKGFDIADFVIKEYN